MKRTINTQSQNEVKDLLNEYVVAPLNVDISKTLAEMEQKIETLEETTKHEISAVCPSVNENISRLKCQLDTSFHFADEEDAFENISKAINNSQEAVTDKIESAQAIITKNLSQLQSDFTRVTESFEKSGKAVEETRESIIAQLQKTEELIRTNHNNLSEKTNSLVQNISDGFEKQDVVLNNYHLETNAAIQTIESQQKEIIEKKYKTLFMISSSFGIANTIGIIVMIVLFLLK